MARTFAIKIRPDVRIVHLKHDWIAATHSRPQPAFTHGATLRPGS